MDLAVDDPGGDGPLVVGLPVLGQSRAATAAALSPALRGLGLREAYLDLPGHGDSRRTPRATSQAVLDAVVAWLEPRGPALLAGTSYGAYLAAGIARQRPDLVRGLLLVCPGVRLEQEDRDLPDLPPPSDDLGWLSDVPPWLRGHLDKALGHRTREVAAAVMAALESGGLGDQDFQDQLSGGPGYALPDEDADVVVDVPVAVVAGRQDRLVGYADQWRAMRHYPRGTNAVLDGAGHYLPFEQPALLRAVAHDWVRRVLAG